MRSLTEVGLARTGGVRHTLPHTFVTSPTFKPETTKNISLTPHYYVLSLLAISGVSLLSILLILGLLVHLDSSQEGKHAAEEC